MDTGISIFHFNDKINFWLVRANGGNYFDDFINNDYIGIKYNRVTVSDLNKLKSKEIVSLDNVRNLMFEQYAKSKKSSVEALSTISKSQLTVHAKQTYLFNFEMKIGDFILTPNKKSYEFALGVVVSEAYDERIDVIAQRKEEFENGDIAYVPSDYRKRRKICWLSILERRELPRELAWIMNAHQAVALLDIPDKSQLLNLVSPIYKYNDKYYLRIFTQQGGELSVYDWSAFLSLLPEKRRKAIELHADVNSPVFFTFLTYNVDDIKNILNLIFGSSANNYLRWMVVTGGVIVGLVGMDNLKNKGIIEWWQDVCKRHKQNKVDNLKLDNEYQQLKTSKGKGNKGIIHKLKLKLKRPGKKIDKNNDKIVPLDLKDKKHEL